MNTTIKTNRIEAIDALRGFAIIGILLIHSIEHFDLYFLPEHLPVWMKTLDAKITDFFFFLLGGKAYSIFSILFGVTFYIQLSKQIEKGKDFSGRFAWRMVLLFGFGLLNTAFYVGDILLYYAVIGLILIPVRKLKTGLIFFIALFLLAQPVEWIKLILECNGYSFRPMHEIYGPYWEGLNITMKDPSFIHMVIGNFKGNPGHLLWFWSDGRVFQTAGLFLIGFLLGRMKVFYTNPENTRFWIKTGIISTLIFLPLYFFNFGIANSIFHLWSNVAFTFTIISTFILLYQTAAKKVLTIFTPMGKMSLTSYMMQSVSASFIYYGYGLGVYQYTGATYSILIGICMGACLWLFCTWWLKSHKQGPLEYIWHKLTWM